VPGWKAERHARERADDERAGGCHGRSDPPRQFRSDDRLSVVKERARIWLRVDNDNHFASFFAKKWLQTIIVFREKMTR
jgi:hypothetical protein